MFCFATIDVAFLFELTFEFLIKWIQYTLKFFSNFNINWKKVTAVLHSVVKFHWWAIIMAKPVWFYYSDAWTAHTLYIKNIFGTVATTGQGLTEAIDWLLSIVKQKINQLLKPINDAKQMTASYNKKINYNYV